MQTANAPKSYKIAKYKISYVKERDAETLPQRTISHKADVAELAQKYLSDLPFEQVLIVALNSGNKIIGITTEGSGASNQCVANPQNTFRFLLSVGAASFILCHNHPGESTRASEADWTLTKRFQDIGKGLDIPMLDHLIVAGPEAVVSMRETTRW